MGCIMYDQIESVRFCWCIAKCGIRPCTSPGNGQVRIVWWSITGIVSIIVIIMDKLIFQSSENTTHIVHLLFCDQWLWFCLSRHMSFRS